MKIFEKLASKTPLNMVEEKPKLPPIGKLDEYPAEWKEEYIKQRDSKKGLSTNKPSTC